MWKEWWVRSRDPEFQSSISGNRTGWARSTGSRPSAEITALAHVFLGNELDILRNLSFLFWKMVIIIDLGLTELLMRDSSETTKISAYTVPVLRKWSINSSPLNWLMNWISAEYYWCWLMVVFFIKKFIANPGREICCTLGLYGSLIIISFKILFLYDTVL